MLKMSQKQTIIIRYFRQGKSQREISRELGISRPTIRKYIKEYEKQLREETKADSTELSSSILDPPKYNTSTRKKSKLTAEIIAQIDKHLEKNEEKRKSGLRKQQLKKIDVWEILVESGYEISYPTVCNYIRSKEGRKEAFIRQSYSPGSVCEFDWGEVKLKIDGVKKVYQLAVFTLAWSNYRFAFLYARQHTQSFQQSHVLFFEHLGGIPSQMVYDNMRVAVKRFVGPTEKEPTDALLGMSMYYQFDFRFCNVRKGNEKGHVERSVEYIRRKAFARQDEFTDLAEANEYLFNKLEQLNDKEQQGKQASGSDLLKQASSHLGLLPKNPMECAQWKSLRVDKYSTICLATNHYSVPEELVGKMIEAKIYTDRLDIYYNRQALWSHQRRYTSFQWYLYLGHYLETLKRKPGALKGAAALEQASLDLKRIYAQHFQSQPRQFIELLHYQRAKSLSWLQIKQAIQDLLRLGCKEITLDKIKVRLENAPVQNAVAANGKIEQMAKAQLVQLANLFNLN